MDNGKIFAIFVPFTKTIKTMTNQNKRVVITGMGVISPVGNDLKTFQESLLNGKCGIATLEHGDSKEWEGINVKVAAQVKDFKATEYGLTPQEARKSDRFSQFATAAAVEAMKMSGLESGVNIDPERLGVYVGSGIGGLDTFIKQTKVSLTDGGGLVSPLFVPMMISNIAGGNIAIKFKAQGPCLATVAACATGTNSIGEAFYAVQRGDADAIITGGTDATIFPLTLGGFQNARALSLEADPAKACLPFDARRSGFVIGEGAGIAILEEYEHAKARGAEIIAEVVGYANTCDAYHFTAPSPEGKAAARAIRLALDQAGYKEGETMYFNAHGTGTHLNDSCETKALKLAIGEEAAHKVLISSTKSMTGHMIAAAGAVEFIASALALRDGMVPPTIGLEQPDPECDLDYVPLKARKADLDLAVSNSLGFGGHNATIVLRKANG